MTVNERIEALRQLMAENCLDVYYVPNEDDHLSEEYTADYFKAKSYMSGFSGESGCVIVTKDFAGLWTDGRYFTQAENELAGSQVELMRLRQEGIPNPLDFLVDQTPVHGKLGFDGSVVSARTKNFLQKKLERKQASIVNDVDLVGQIWNERPKMPEESLFVLDTKYTGVGAKDKIAQVRQSMLEAGADVLFLAALEDPCWLLNIRGNDIENTPVTYAFVLMTENEVNYYVNEKKVNVEVQAHLENSGVTIKDYDEIETDLLKLQNKVVLANLDTLNSKLYTALQGNTILDQESPIAYRRAIKNEVEIECTKNAHVKDGVAVFKFIHWLKNEVKKNEVTEVSAQNKLYDLRGEGQDYIEPSFTTISAYQANGAMMHYSATEENHAKLEPKGFLLVDSGGTYKDGTTDITRTIAVGPLTKEEKKYYTLVLKGHLDLMAAHFLKGTTGNNVDILARQPLWKEDIDYQCGTGHGVGHVLAVHEGPHRIGWGFSGLRPPVPFEAGMIVTDEPGVYLPHELGIRIENELLVVNGNKNFYGQFMHFETLTYVPYEVEAIEVSLLTDEELIQLNAYHAQVRAILSPYLKGEELAYLEEVTKELVRS
ncbi:MULTISPECIES: aminopeptidase P family protein [Terrabacteria group]|uniref:aminopeptidase P family protein n=1 Tax=Bacillati TaxID=1783272 RepID=UPI001C6F2E6F|nr:MULTISPECIES: aminopeptidase P family protein [Terrabacteria group]MBW9212719.1 aminopeptidase P family protein [Trueperella sp. zg.1013]